MRYFKHGGQLERRNTKSVSALVVGSLTVLVVVSFTQLYTPTTIPLSLEEPVLFNNEESNHPPKVSNNNNGLHLAQTNAPPYNLVKLSRYNTVAETKLGKVQGSIEESRDGRVYVAFRNIPFAKPPVGPLRFKNPEPAEPWEGTRDGSKFGPQCIQREKHVEELRSAGEEDCLYLNIYTPECKCPTTDVPNPNPQYPVMVYIHGGQYNSGNGSRYGPDYFMDESVVLITLEFRVGVFGFISTDDEHIRGNMGFKDIIMALRWVQENIDAFGGNKDKVTIFGNSSGGSTVHALLLSHMSKGLFHGAISQSGTMMRGGGAIPTGLGKLIVAEGIGKEFGCPTNSTAELVACLQDVDAKDLAIVQGPLIQLTLPIVEAIPENGTADDVFLSNATWNLINDVDNYPMKVPWIAGDNSAELLSNALDMLRDVDKIDALNEDWEVEGKTILEFRHPPSERKMSEIKHFYFGHLNITNSTRHMLVDMLSDNAWVHGTKVAALAHAQHSPVYLYYLTRESAKSYAEDSMVGYDPPFGVSHADELQYLFLYDGYPEIPIGSVHTKFSQKLVRNWAYFAQHGTPENVNWTAIDVADNGTVWFKLDDEPKMTTRLKRRMRFWDDYVYEVYQE